MAPALGLLIGGGLSAIGSIFGSRSAAKAQQQANEANLAATRETNALNKQMFDESRGSTGSAVLPSYLRGYEASLASNAARSANDLMGYGGGTSGRLTSAASTIGGYLPLIGQGDAYLNRLYSGGLLADRQGFLAPVAAARTAAADSAANAIDQSIYGAIGRIDADAARRGFSGGSTFDRNRILAATIGAKLAAAQERSNARLTNAGEARDLAESDVALRMANLGQGFSRAGDALSLSYAPLETEARFMGNGLNPLNFFRMGQSTFQYQRPDSVEPVANTGMALGAGLSQIGSAIGGYYGTQGLIKAMK